MGRRDSRDLLSTVDIEIYWESEILIEERFPGSLIGNEVEDDASMMLRGIEAMLTTARKWSGSGYFGFLYRENESWSESIGKGS